MIGPGNQLCTSAHFCALYKSTHPLTHSYIHSQQFSRFWRCRPQCSANGCHCPAARVRISAALKWYMQPILDYRALPIFYVYGTNRLHDGSKAQYEPSSLRTPPHSDCVSSRDYLAPWSISVIDSRQGGAVYIALIEVHRHRMDFV